MKKIGETIDHNILIEMSQKEYQLLSRLSQSLEGKTINEIYMRDDYGTVSGDYSGVFGAIEAFALSKFRINELQALVDRFNAVLEKVA